MVKEQGQYEPLISYHLAFRASKEGPWHHISHPHCRGVELAPELRVRKRVEHVLWRYTPTDNQANIINVRWLVKNDLRRGRRPRIGGSWMVRPVAEACLGHYRHPVVFGPPVVSDGMVWRAYIDRCVEWYWPHLLREDPRLEPKAV